MIPAFASLIGDTMHVKITDTTIPFLLCDQDVVVMDPGVEIPDCFGQIKVDIDGNSIWVESLAPFANGGLIPALTVEFTEMHWTNNPNGIITGVTILPTSNVPNPTETIGDHSIILTGNQFNIDCGGQSTCLVKLHLDIETIHTAVGGEFIGIDSTMVLAAGAQYTAAWMIPVIVSGIGFAIVIARKF